MTNLKRIAAFTLISGGIALGTLAVAESATASPLNIVDNGDGTATGYWQLPVTGTWPQAAINPAALCGVVQADVYPYATATDKARTDALTTDSTLTEGEDFGWPTSWTIKEYPACATIPSTTGSASPMPTSSAPTHTSSPPISPSPTVSVPSPASTPSSPPATTAPTPSATPTASTTPTPTNTSAPSPTSITVTSPTPTATSTSTSTPAAYTSTISGQANGSTELAYTGANTGPAIGGAVALLVGGLVMLALGRRNRNAN